MPKKERIGREERKEGNLSRTGRDGEVEKGELHKKKWKKRKCV